MITEHIKKNLKLFGQHRGLEIDTSDIQELDNNIILFDCISTKICFCDYSKNNHHHISSVYDGCKIICFISKNTRNTFIQDNIEYIHINILKINVIDHRLVPKHEKINVQSLPKKLQPRLLPKMKTCDPVSIWLGLSKGDLVIVYRTSETMGESIVYKLVV
tara:strand:- start:70 stop:552 length:483 start_codon:yes stop_codon:yes gene_type:complete